MARKTRRRKKESIPVEKKNETKSVVEPSIENESDIQSCSTDTASPFELTPDLESDRLRKSFPNDFDDCLSTTLTDDTIVPMSSHAIAELSSAMTEEHASLDSIYETAVEIPQKETPPMTVFKNLFNASQPTLEDPTRPLHTDIFEVEHFVPKNISVSTEVTQDSRPSGISRNAGMNQMALVGDTIDLKDNSLTRSTSSLPDLESEYDDNSIKEPDSVELDTIVSNMDICVDVDDKTQTQVSYRYTPEVLALEDDDYSDLPLLEVPYEECFTRPFPVVKSLQNEPSTDTMQYEASSMSLKDQTLLAEKSDQHMIDNPHLEDNDTINAASLVVEQICQSEKDLDFVQSEGFPSSQIAHPTELLVNLNSPPEPHGPESNVSNYSNAESSSNYFNNAVFDEPEVTPLEVQTSSERFPMDRLEYNANYGSTDSIDLSYHPPSSQHIHNPSSSDSSSSESDADDDIEAAGHNIPQLSFTFQENTTIHGLESYSVSVLKALYQMQQTGTACDLTLYSTISDTFAVSIHSFLLQATCTTTILTKRMYVSLNETELSILVDFLYTGKLYLSVANIDPYLKISQAFGGIQLIKEKMLKYLTQSVNAENYFTIIELAQKYNQEELKLTILNHIMAKVDQYRSEILRLSPTNFKQLISMNELNVGSETKVVQLLKDWVVANSEHQQSLPSILPAVRFACLPPDFIVNEIASDNIFGGECSQTVMKGMSYHLLCNAKFDNPLAQFCPRKAKPSLIIIGCSPTATSEPKIPVQYYKHNEWHTICTDLYPNLETTTGHQMIHKNGFIYILGGENTRTGKKTASNSVYVFDSRLFEMNELSGMNTARTHFAACEVNGKIYVFGGRNERGILRECEVFDIKANTWSKIRSLSKPRCCHAASAIGSDIFLSGGYIQEASNISKYTKSILSYATKCNLWQDVGDLITARGWHQMVSHGSYAYIVGGCYQGASKRTGVDTIERVSSSKEIVELDIRLLKLSSTPGAFGHKDKLYITGGWDESKKQYSTACQELDLKTYAIRYSEFVLPKSITVHQSAMCML